MKPHGAPPRDSATRVGLEARDHRRRRDRASTGSVRCASTNRLPMPRRPKGTRPVLQGRPRRTARSTARCVRDTQPRSSSLQRLPAARGSAAGGFFLVWAVGRPATTATARPAACRHADGRLERPSDTDDVVSRARQPTASARLGKGAHRHLIRLSRPDLVRADGGPLHSPPAAVYFGRRAVRPGSIERCSATKRWRRSEPTGAPAGRIAGRTAVAVALRQHPKPVGSATAPSGWTRRPGALRDVDRSGALFQVTRKGPFAATSGRLRPGRWRSDPVGSRPVRSSTRAPWMSPDRVAPCVLLQKRGRVRPFTDAADRVVPTCASRRRQVGTVPSKVTIVPRMSAQAVVDDERNPRPATRRREGAPAHSPTREDRDGRAPCRRARRGGRVEVCVPEPGRLPFEQAPGPG